MQEQKQFSKIFDAAQDQFVILKEKKDLDALEINRYLTSQLNLLQAKVIKLQAAIAKGATKESSGEAQRRILEFEKRIQLLYSRIQLYEVMFQETEHSIKSLRAATDFLVAIPDATKLVGRVNELEKTYGLFSTLRIRNIFLNLVETVKLLIGRVRNLEKISFLLEHPYFEFPEKKEEDSAKKETQFITPEYDGGKSAKDSTKGVARDLKKKVIG